MKRSRRRRWPLEGRDPGQAQFVDQAILEGTVQTFSTAARLWGVGADVLDAQAREGAAHVGEVVGSTGPPPWACERPSRRDRCTGERQAEGPHDVSERAHDGLQRLRGPELGVEQTLGGVVEHGDERLPLVGTERQPGMGAAIQVQELAEAGARLAPTAMAAARRRLRTRPASWRASLTKLYERVTPCSRGRPGESAAH